MTRNLTDLWPLLQEIRAVGGAAQRRIHTDPPPIPVLVEAFGMTQSVPYIGALLYTLENYDRTALSTAHYRVRNVYDNPAVVDKTQAALAADGFLEAVGDHYRVTDRGLSLYSRTKELVRPRWELPLNLPEGTFDRIFALMERLVAATFAVAEPPPHWAVTTRSQRGLPRPDHLAARERLDWHIFDLWAYRDDVHLASWSAYPVTPHAWESLTLFWRGQWDSIAALAEELARREFTADDCAGFAAELVGQGWLEQAEGETFRLTEAGEAVREEAERLTDTYFYAPWSCLSDAEVAELRGLLTALRDDLARIAAG